MAEGFVEIAVTVIIFIVVVLFFIACKITSNLLRLVFSPTLSAVFAIVIITSLVFNHYIYYPILFAVKAPSQLSSVTEVPEGLGSIHIIDPDNFKYDSDYREGIIVKRYLDGARIKLIAISRNDGTVHVYKNNPLAKNFGEIIEKVSVYSSIDDIPDVQYTISVEPIHESINEDYIADRLAIIDSNDNMIAYSYRYWSYAPMISKILAPKSSVIFGVKKGQGPYSFLEKNYLPSQPRFQQSYLEAAQDFDFK